MASSHKMTVTLQSPYMVRVFTTYLRDLFADTTATSSNEAMHSANREAPYRSQELTHEKPKNQQRCPHADEHRATQRDCFGLGLSYICHNSLVNCHCVV